jgi:predicted RecB family endonuclease
MSRDDIISFKVNEHEKEYAEKLADKLGVSVSEAMRIILFDSRFLYSEGVDFGEVEIPPDDLLEEEQTSTTGKEAVKRIFE